MFADLGVQTLALLLGNHLYLSSYTPFTPYSLSGPFILVSGLSFWGSIPELRPPGILTPMMKLTVHITWDGQQPWLVLSLVLALQLESGE